LAHSTVDVLLASEHGFAARSADDPLLRHKTTFREDYDHAWREAEAQGAFDMLFFNERGELTEGGRSNVFVRLDGRWSTPPLGAGLLPGVMRGVLIEELEAEERTLTREDLGRAESLMICNALRGALPARLKRIS
jgi:para-aminobenzoate synthetase/4-amino-4-deoxychorismate lyase